MSQKRLTTITEIMNLPINVELQLGLISVFKVRPDEYEILDPMGLSLFEGEAVAVSAWANGFNSYSDVDCLRFSL